MKVGREKQWRTCALVGQGGGAASLATGQAIDAHDAVWRFNLDSPGEAGTWLGTRTTVRVMNHIASSKAADTQRTQLKESAWKEGEREVRAARLACLYLCNI